MEEDDGPYLYSLLKLLRIFKGVRSCILLISMTLMRAHLAMAARLAGIACGIVLPAYGEATNARHETTFARGA